MIRFPLALAASLIAAPAFAMPASICQPLSEAASSAMELRQMGTPRSTLDAMLKETKEDANWQLAFVNGDRKSVV